MTNVMGYLFIIKLKDHDLWLVILSLCSCIILVWKISIIHLARSRGQPVDNGWRLNLPKCHMVLEISQQSLQMRPPPCFQPLKYLRQVLAIPSGFLIDANCEIIICPAWVNSPTYGIILSDGLGSRSAILVTPTKGDETSVPNIGVTRL